MASSAFATTLCIAIGFCFRPAIVPGQVASAQKGQSSTSSTQPGLEPNVCAISSLTCDMGIYRQLIQRFAQDATLDYSRRDRVIVSTPHILRVHLVEQNLP